MFISTDFYAVLTSKYAGAELEGGGGEVFPAFFLKIGKKCPNFWGKCPDCGHLCVKFFHLKCKGFQEEKPEIFLYGAFLSSVVNDCLSKCPNF